MRLESKSAWVPEFGVADSARERVGGVPSGLSVELHPRCMSCGQAMTFIGQFAHHNERLPLSSVSSVLFAFLCEDYDCAETAGIPGLSSPSHSTMVLEFDSRHSTGTTDSGGLDIVGWSIVQEYYLSGADGFLFHGAEPGDEMRTTMDVYAAAPPPHGGTKIGGVPAWIQDPAFGAVGSGLTYVAQWSDCEQVLGKAAFTNLESGRLFLLRSAGGFDLYYQAR